MSYVIAVDSGGTFTDCVVICPDGAALRAKSPSTPPEFERGVLNAVEEAARRLDLTLEGLLDQTTLFAHGTTVATNIVITGNGARTALLTTRGHEDAIIIGRTVQKVAGLTEEEVIDVARLSKAKPLVPRSRIHGIDERVDRSGSIVVPLHEDRLDDLARQLREEGVESVAISLLWSFKTPEHEERLEAWLSKALNGNGSPPVFITRSSELAPVIREYERTSTTVLNAYLTPAVRGYLQRMHDRLRDGGHKGAITVMHSAGGVFSIDEARRRGVALLSSGPAGGILGTRELASRLGLDKVIATDVGGTSFDIGLVVDGEPSYADAPVFAQYPVALPVIDVPSIGAGGGSIAWVEPETGVLRVGPQSAGARPGPACYGTGTEPTVTDANLVLGRINPGYFLGGRLHLDLDRAREAVATVAEPLGMSVEATAAAIIDIVNAQMSDLIRKVTVERGLDPSQFAVFGYGGAAGLHVDAYSSMLHCGEVILPRTAATFSAFGIAHSDVKRVSVVSDPARAPFDLGHWRQRLEDVESSLRADLEKENLPTDTLQVRRFAELLFRGQVHTVRVPIDDADLAADDAGETIIDRFTELYEDKYGRGTAYRTAGVEVMSFVVEASARLPRPDVQPLPLEGEDAEHARMPDRDVFFAGADGYVPTRVYDAERLRPGNAFMGPALVDAEDTTILVGDGHRLWVDEYQNMRLELTTTG